MKADNFEEKMRIVNLEKYNPNWPEQFSIAAAEIKNILGNNLIAIHHIGSTSIPNIYAKPIIDILPVVKDISLVDVINREFENFGYMCMGEYGIPGRRYFWKSKKKRTHHIHLFEQGSPEIARHLAFKDFLLSHPKYAETYSILKLNLANAFPADIENYIKGKSAFIQVIDYKTGHPTQLQLNALDLISLEQHNPAWLKLGEVEIKTIQQITHKIPYIAMKHLGSTAVPDLSAKPIIDIFILIENIKDAQNWIEPLETLGYIFWKENPDKLHLRFFKGMPPFGTQRTHHIHIISDPNAFEQRYMFREILNSQPVVKQKYEALKKELSAKYFQDREKYTNKKTSFIEHALREYGYTKLKNQMEKK